MKRKRKKKTRAMNELQYARLIKRRQWEEEYGEKRQHTAHTIEVDKGEIFIVYD
jgi:hypothetical protein